MNPADMSGRMSSYWIQRCIEELLPSSQDGRCECERQLPLLKANTFQANNIFGFRWNSVRVELAVVMSPKPTTASGVRWQ